MDKFNFEELKNFEVPESWVQGALDLQKEKKKKPFLLLHYQHVIGFAAALVIAVGVSVYLFFGSGGNSRVNIPSLSPQSTTQAEQNTGDNKGSTGNSNSPTIQLPSINSQDATSQNVTEPAETGGNSGGNSSKPKQSATAPTSGSTKSGSQNATKHSGGDTPSETQQTQTDSDIPKPETEPPETQAPTQYYPPPTEEPTNEPVDPATEEPWVEQGCGFTAFADATLAQGNVYCRVENQNGVILGSGGLFGSSRLADKWNTAYEDTKLLIYECPFTIDLGKTYTVIFYNSKGNVIKQRTLTIYESDYYEIY